MKKAISLLLALSIVFTLCACGHKHTWLEATCTKPKTCSECGETEGEALGHTWEEATCTKPKTCSVCGETEGKALGHQATPASCTEASICSICGEIISEATGHEWKDATAGRPKTCIKCGLTEGDPLGYSYFSMDSYEFVDAYNRSEHALGTLSKSDGNEMRVTGTNLKIIFFVSDAAREGSKYEGKWIIPEIDFNVMAIRMPTYGTDQYYDTTSLTAVTLIGQSFAEILDPTFDCEDFIENSAKTISSDGKDITISYSHNGFEYTLITMGGKTKLYDFIISLSANNE